MDSILKAVGLSKIYTQGDSKTEAVKNANIEIFPGEKIAVTGPSGCGKPH